MTESEPARHQVSDSPRQDLERALTTAEGPEVISVLTEIARRWARLDPAQALSDLDVSQFENEFQRKAFRLAVIDAAIEQDPVRALGLLNELTDYLERQHLVHGAMTLLATTDPMLGLTLARELSHEGTNFAWDALDALISDQNVSVLRQFAERARQAADPKWRQQLSEALVEPYVARAPREALAWAQRMDGRVGGDLWADVASTLAGTQPMLALDLFQSLPESASKQSLMAGIAKGMAKVDLSLSVQLADQLPPGWSRRMVRTAIADHWIGVDPESAFRWIQSQDQQARLFLLERVRYRLISEYPELAADQLHHLPQAERDQWIGQLVTRMAEDDPSLAMAWLEMHPDFQHFGTRMGGLAMQLTQQNAAAALALIDSIHDPEQQLNAQGAIVAQWMASDTSAAARWMAQQAPGTRSHQALGAIARQLYFDDPRQGMAWILGLELSVERDATISALVGQTVTDPGEAQALIERITDPRTRSQAQLDYLLWLADFDALSVRTLMNEVDLQDDHRERLHEALEGEQEERLEVVMWH